MIVIRVYNYSSPIMVFTNSVKHLCNYWNRLVRIHRGTFIILNRDSEKVFSTHKLALILTGKK